MRIRIVALAALFLATSTLAAARAVEVGSTVPDLALAAVGDGERVLSQRDAPTILVFFRGVW